MSHPYAWRILRVFLQDCVCLISPQPNNPSTLPKVWSTLPKQRHTAPRSANLPRSANASCAAIPSLHTCHVKNILCRVPMMSCFVGGNTQPTIPYCFRTQRARAGWTADTRPDASNGSRLYQLNLGMWRYGRGQESTVSILEAWARAGEARARAGETVNCPSVSRMHHVCIAYWPVWCVIPTSVCRQRVWELQSKADAVADGPVLGVLMSVMFPKQGRASALSWVRSTDCQR